MTSRAPPPRSGHETVLVCGASHIGFRVSRSLLRLGVDVTVLGLEVRADRARALSDAGGRVLTGDGRDERELERAGIADAQALVALTDTDLVNLEIALDARRLRPELRLALRVFDRDLARSLEQSLGRARAVGVSALSAPVMALGALGWDASAGFALGEHEFLVGTVRVAQGSPFAGASAGSIGARFGVAVLGAPERVLAPGDRFTAVGPRSAYLALPRETTEQAAMPPVAAPRRRLSALRTAWSNAPRPLRRVFLVLLAVCALSVLVFRFGVDPPIDLVEAFYYTVTTVTTTGYGDITPRGAGPLMMVYASLFMLLGSVTMAILYSFITSYVVSEQLRAELGRPALPRGGHVLVAGLGSVGYRTWAELLRAGHEVVAIDLALKGEFASALVGRPFVAGDARLSATLEAARVGTARALIAATDDDATNLSVALTARRLAPQIRTVVRVFDADLAAKLEDGKLVDLAVSTSRVAAPTFAAAALFEDVVVGVEDESELVALCLARAGAAWEGRAPSELGIEVALVERETCWVPWDAAEPLPSAARVLTVERRGERPRS